MAGTPNLMLAKVSRYIVGKYRKSGNFIFTMNFTTYLLTVLQVVTRSYTITQVFQLFNDVHTTEFQAARDGLLDLQGGGPAMQKSRSCDGS
jgi:hypothetical protein